MAELSDLAKALWALSPWRSDNRWEWLRIGMAIHAGTAGSNEGFHLWDSWSQQSIRYKSGCTLYQWRSFKVGGGIGVGTLFHAADQDSPGWRETHERVRSWSAVPQVEVSSEQPTRHKSEYRTPDEAVEAVARLFGRKANQQWDYLDCEWNVCGHILRWNNPNDKKTYRPVSRLHNGLWIIGGMPEPRPLYRLPYIRNLGMDVTVWVVEGEKAADALISEGIEATTSSQGAQAPHKTHWGPLAGRDVIINPDRDDASESFTEAVAAILSKLEPPATVNVLRLPGAAKSDAYDFIQERRKQLDKY